MKSGPVAIIDIGSNSIKMLVALKHGDGHIHVLHEESISTRLSQSVDSTLTLQAEAIDKAIRTLQDLLETAKAHRVHGIQAYATSAVRDARNKTEFVGKIHAETGIDVQVIDGRKEAKFVFLGATADPFFADKPILVVDVGGGSTEWVAGNSRKISSSLSLPIGAVRLTERFIRSDPPRRSELTALKAYCRNEVQKIQSFFPASKKMNRSHILVGTGGTMTSLALIDRSTKRFSPEKVDHHLIDLPTLKEHYKYLSLLSLDERKEIPGLPRNRADIILAGMMIYIASMELLKFEKIYASARGLRHGALMEFYKVRNAF